MPKLRLTLACWNYDRTRALLEDRVPIDGIELNYLNLPVEETFFRMLRQPRIRCRGAVAFFIHRFAIQRSRAVHRDPRLPFAILPALLHLHQRRQRHP